MTQKIHWSCPETRDPFLRTFRAEAAARYERAQAERRRAECEESKRRLEGALKILAAAVEMLDPYTAG